MEAINELKKSKIMRSLNDLVICLATKELDCTHIEGKKEEVLAIMRDLETEFDKI